MRAEAGEKRFVSKWRLKLKDFAERADVQATWVKFIEELDARSGGFEWYTTLTFREETHPESAYKAFEKWQHRINRAVYGVRYWSRPHQGMSSVVALEYQKRGVLHFHALQAGVTTTRAVAHPEWFETPVAETHCGLGACGSAAGARPMCCYCRCAPCAESRDRALEPRRLEFRRLTAMDWWFQMAGIARIYAYQRAGGAERYVSKYVTKGGEIALYGPFSVADGQRLALSRDPASGEERA